jgi:hypothetical protein
MVTDGMSRETELASEPAPILRDALGEGCVGRLKALAKPEGALLAEALWADEGEVDFEKPIELYLDLVCSCS